MAKFDPDSDKFGRRRGQTSACAPGPESRTIRSADFGSEAPVFEIPAPHGAGADCRGHRDLRRRLRQHRLGTKDRRSPNLDRTRPMLCRLPPCEMLPTMRPPKARTLTIPPPSFSVASVLATRPLLEVPSRSDRPGTPSSGTRQNARARQKARGDRRSASGAHCRQHRPVDQTWDLQSLSGPDIVQIHALSTRLGPTSGCHGRPQPRELRGSGICPRRRSFALHPHVAVGSEPRAAKRRRRPVEAAAPAAPPRCLGPRRPPPPSVGGGSVCRGL